MQVYLDMDGVLANFDKGYEKAFGIKTSKELDNCDWRLVEKHKDFYLNLEPMPGFDKLWEFFKPFDPVVLTGVPFSIKDAKQNKRAWVNKYIGPDTFVIPTQSKKKCEYARTDMLGPNLLVDDWIKYKSLWTDAGGYWITFKNVDQVINDFGHLICLSKVHNIYTGGKLNG